MNSAHGDSRAQLLEWECHKHTFADCVYEPKCIVTARSETHKAMYAEAYITYHAWNIFKKYQAQRAGFIPCKQCAERHTVCINTTPIYWCRPIADCIQCRLSPEAKRDYLLCKVLISCAHYERWKQMSRQQWPSCRYGSHNDDTALLKRTLIHNVLQHHTTSALKSSKAANLVLKHTKMHKQNIFPIFKIHFLKKIYRFI